MRDEVVGGGACGKGEGGIGAVGPEDVEAVAE